MRPLQRFDPPEVDGLADPKSIGIASAASQPHTPGQPIEQSPHGPRQRERVPTAVASDPLDRPPHVIGRGVEGHLAVVAVHGAAAPVRIGRHGVARSTRPLRTRPAGDDLGVPHALQSKADGLVERAQRERDQVLDVVLVGDGVVAQRLDQRLGDRLRHGRHDVDPVAREPRRQDRDRDDHPVGQAGDRCVALHHLAVGDDVGPADVEASVRGRVELDRTHEVAEYVANSDRLHERAHPTRRDHDREPLGQVTEHLERCRSAADDHAGLQHDGGHGPVEQDLAHLGT